MCGRRLAFLLDVFLKVDLLGQYRDSVLAFGERSDWFSPRLHHCTFPSAGCGDSSSSTSSPILVDNNHLFIITSPFSKGLNAHGSSTKTFSGISFITFACLAFGPRALTRFSPVSMGQGRLHHVVRPCSFRSVFLRNVQMLQRSGCGASPSATLYPDAAAAEKPGPRKERD